MRRTSFGAIKIGLKWAEPVNRSDNRRRGRVQTRFTPRQQELYSTVRGMGDAEISQQQVLEFEFQWNSNSSRLNCPTLITSARAATTRTIQFLRHGLDNGLSAMDAWNPHAGLAYRPSTRMQIPMLSASS
jgi:hypothetical protein